MGKFAFFAKILQVKSENVGNTAIRELAKRDPVAAVKAQMKLKQDEVDAWRTRVIEAERALATDVAETEAAERAMVTAREQLEQAKEYVESGDLSTGVEKALRKEAEGFAATYLAAKERYEKEMEDDARKQSMLDRVRDAYRKAQSAVDQVQSQLDQAQERMEEAQVNAESSAQEAALLNEMAGLDDPDSSLNVALAAMNDVANEEEQKARAAELRIEEAGGSVDDEPLSMLEKLQQKEAREAQKSADPWDVL